MQVERGSLTYLNHRLHTAKMEAKVAKNEDKQEELNVEQCPSDLVQDEEANTEQMASAVDEVEKINGSFLIVIGPTVPFPLLVIRRQSCLVAHCLWYDRQARRKRVLSWYSRQEWRYRIRL